MEIKKEVVTVINLTPEDVHEILCEHFKQLGIKITSKPSFEKSIHLEGIQSDEHLDSEKMLKMDIDKFLYFMYREQPSLGSNCIIRARNCFFVKQEGSNRRTMTVREVLEYKDNPLRLRNYGTKSHSLVCQALIKAGFKAIDWPFLQFYSRV